MYEINADQGNQVHLTYLPIPFLVAPFAPSIISKMIFKEIKYTNVQLFTNIMSESLFVLVIFWCRVSKLIVLDFLDQYFDISL